MPISKSGMKEKVYAIDSAMQRQADGRMDNYQLNMADYTDPHAIHMDQYKSSSDCASKT